MMTRFTDPVFGPNSKSLLGARGKKYIQSDGDYKDWVNYKWKRASDILENPVVIKDGLNPRDINQGTLGDCYLLSALSALAEFPDRLLGNLLQSTKSPVGGYCVALNIRGCWIEVDIDDYFPVDSEGSAAFSSTNSEELWAMLIEKAYAKCNESWANIGQGAQTGEALSDLTGCPVAHYELSEDKGNLERLIWEADRARYIMTCGTKEKDAMGLSGNHAYTLMWMVELPGGPKLIKIRNPYGSGEWKGDWSDDSKLWTSECKKAAGWTSDDDGIFFMDFKDFSKWFGDVAICHYRDSYFYSYLPVKCKRNEIGMVQFKVHAPGEYYLGMSQASAHEMRPEYGDKSSLAILTFNVLLSNGNGGFSWLNSFSSSSRDPWFMSTLEKGDYIIIYNVHPSADLDDYTVWTYGTGNVVLSTVCTDVISCKSMSILADGLLQKAKNMEGWDDSYLESSKIRYNYQEDNTGYGYIAFENRDSEISCRATVMIKTTSAKFVYPLCSQNCKQISLDVPPLQFGIILYRICKLPHELSFEFSFSFANQEQ